MGRGRRTKSGKDRALLKKEIIERLAQGYGIRETCDILQVGHGTYYNWRNKDPEFKADVERILSDPLHATRILNRSSKEELGVEENWKLRFLGVYRRTGDRNEALRSAGKRAIEIEQALDSAGDHYDAEFARLFSDEEQKRLWKIEDNALRKAEHDMPTARFVLSNLVKDKYGKLEGTTTVQQVWFTQKGEENAMKEIESMFSEPEVKEIEATSDTGTV